MSMVASIWEDDDGYQYCWCPACGELVEVDDDEECGMLDDGNKEYFVHCCECGQNFYASKGYDY